MKKPAFRGRLVGTIAQVAQALRDMKLTAQRLAVAPFLLAAFAVTGETCPYGIKSCRDLVENYL